MLPCIAFKTGGRTIQMKHQCVYTGVEDQVHCVNHCGIRFETKQDSDMAFEWDKQVRGTRWPEGAEL